MSAERVLALLARWSGMDVGSEVSAKKLLETFDLGRVPREQIVFTEADDRFLRD